MSVGYKKPKPETCMYMPYANAKNQKPAKIGTV